jgi:hypothetical protein
MGCPRCKNDSYYTLGFETISVLGHSRRWEVLECTACKTVWMQARESRSEREKKKGMIDDGLSKTVTDIRL